MTNTLPVSRVSDVAPDLVRGLGFSVAGLAAVVARRFLRDPKFMTLILPLWGWLNRSVRRFGRLRVVAARPVAPRVMRERATRTPGVRLAVRLPSGRGWLVQALGWEAAGYGSQLQALLATPEMVALLDAVPAVGRVLRPLGRILGVTVGTPVVKLVPLKPVRSPRPRPKRVRRKLVVSPLSGRVLPVFARGRPPKKPE